MVVAGGLGKLIGDTSARAVKANTKRRRAAPRRPGGATGLKALPGDQQQRFALARWQRRDRRRELTAHLDRRLPAHALSSKHALQASHQRSSATLTPPLISEHSTSNLK